MLFQSVLDPQFFIMIVNLKTSTRKESIKFEGLGDIYRGYPIIMLACFDLFRPLPHLLLVNDRI